MNDEAKHLEPGSPVNSAANFAAHSPSNAPGNSYVNLLIEFGPLAAFGVTYLAGGIFWATAAVMVTSLIALAASWRRFGRLLPVPLLTAVLVVVFGGLTFWLNDPRFIKVKPTIINLLFAGVLLFGLMTDRPLLKLLLGEAFRLTEEGWRKLSVRWAAFFLALAGLNEVVWRNFSEASWVNFKVFGILGLSLVFAMAQVGLIKRHEAQNEPLQATEPPSEAGGEDKSRADKVRAD
jgi:intracellular septation protein